MPHRFYEQTKSCMRCISCMYKCVYVVVENVCIYVCMWTQTSLNSTHCGVSQLLFANNNSYLTKINILPSVYTYIHSYVQYIYIFMQKNTFTFHCLRFRIHIRCALCYPMLCGALCAAVPK